MCPGGCSRNIRHNTVREMIAKAARDLCHRTDIKHGGGFGDHRRQGYVIVYETSADRCAVINPLCVSHCDNLVKDGVGGSATAYENHKLRAYSEIESSSYVFVPFVLETCGGVGWRRDGRRLCEKLQDRLEGKEYW